MKTYTIARDIDASAQSVWRVLTQDLLEDPIPFGILKIDGVLAKDGRLKLWSEVDPKRAFALKVVRFEAPHTMVWRGGMPFGLFTGTRTFALSASDQSTRFEMHEVFSGALSGMITSSMPDLAPSFEKFAQALKEKAENHG